MNTAPIVKLDLLHPYTQESLPVTSREYCRVHDTTAMVFCDDPEIAGHTPWKVITGGIVLIFTVILIFSFQFEVTVNGVHTLSSPMPLATFNPLSLIAGAGIFGIILGWLVTRGRASDFLKKSRR